VLDSQAELALPDGLPAVLGDSYLDSAADFDLLVRSPGVHPRLLPSGVAVTSSTIEFFARCPAPIVGVTGTKGKGTTSTLIARILERAGKSVWLGGNIGRPGLEFLHQVQTDDIVVLELSSFQLMDLKQSPQMAVCLMIEPEHLDWHADALEYVTAKSAIARFQSKRDLIVFHATNAAAVEIAALSAGRHIPYLRQPGAVIENNQIMMAGEQICQVDEVGLLGRHNLENVCAAVTVTWELVGRRIEVIAAAVREFQGLPYRLEPMEEIGRVLYVNDSFSAHQLATRAAIMSFTRPMILIVGGFDRGIDLAPLAEAIVLAAPKAVVTMGETGPVIAQLVGARGYAAVHEGGPTMTQVVARARELAQSGDVVVFSPGCASFDMFKNYQDRGEQFRRAVAGLKERQ
jgi:UDP-N-acetylmuramoylalanine--D-glutamate ligase